MRKFRDNILTKSISGRKYLKVLEENKLEILKLLQNDKIRKQILPLLKKVNTVVETRDDQAPLTFKKELINELQKTLEMIEPRTKPKLKKAINELKKDLSVLENKNIKEALRKIDQQNRQ